MLVRYRDDDCASIDAHSCCHSPHALTASHSSHVTQVLAPRVPLAPFFDDFSSRFFFCFFVLLLCRIIDDDDDDDE